MRKEKHGKILSDDFISRDRSIEHDLSCVSRTTAIHLNFECNCHSDNRAISNSCYREPIGNVSHVMIDLNKTTFIIPRLRLPRMSQKTPIKILLVRIE